MHSSPLFNTRMAQQYTYGYGAYPAYGYGQQAPTVGYMAQYAQRLPYAAPQQQQQQVGYGVAAAAYSTTPQAQTAAAAAAAAAAVAKATVTQVAQQQQSGRYGRVYMLACVTYSVLK